MSSKNPLNSPNRDVTTKKFKPKSAQFLINRI